MLTGIKRGKKKKASASDASSSSSSSSSPQKKMAVPPSSSALHATATATATALPRENNVQAAAALKAALSQGWNMQTGTSNKASKNNNSQQQSNDNDNTEQIMATTATAGFSSSGKREEDMTMAELAAYERQSGGAAADDEAKAILRTHKRRKIKDNKIRYNSDDEDRLVERHLDALKSDTLDASTSKSSAVQLAKMQRRFQSRQLAAHDQQQAMIQKAWWWTQNAAKFDVTSLVSLSPHVSLALAPASRSWHPDATKYPHFYMVPIPATPSGAACDESTWHDVKQYQAALGQMAADQNKGVIFTEVVLPSNAGSGKAGFHQANIHAMVVPRRLQQDAALIFRMALQELVLDHGTHQKKIIPIVTKDLPRLVPSHFGYIYVEFGNGTSGEPSNNSGSSTSPQGYVLVLEERSSGVNADWAIEVLGGRLGLDPIRMRRHNNNNKTASQKEGTNMASRVAALMETWKDYDWTTREDEAK